MAEIDPRLDQRLRVVRADPGWAGELYWRSAAAGEAVASMLGVALPERANRWTEGTVDALWLAPGHVLLLSSAAPAVPAATPEAHLVETTGAWAGFAVVGDVAAALLARGTPLDLDPRLFGPGDCARTWFAQLRVVIRRRQGGFDLLCDRAIAAWLDDWFADVLTGFTP